MKKALVAAAITGAVLVATPANANHNVVHGAETACTRELDETVDRLIAQGLLSPAHVAVTDHGVFLYATSPVPLVEAGGVKEWALGHDGYGRHYQDTYWEYLFDGVSNWTLWKSACVPATVTPTTTSTTSTTTSSPPPSTSTTTTSTPPPIEPEPPKQDPIPAPEPQPPEVEYDDDDGNTTTSLPAYDLYDAEWDGWPFEITVRLLEERYVPNTPNRRHFSISAAVDYLRSGGLVAGLDHVWESG